ncbi:unnamed protein product [Dicrocoelium dendriticum]|nr:unnamed protein product [Dicrocoelium dendriticum]
MLHALFFFNFVIEDVSVGALGLQDSGAEQRTTDLNYAGGIASLGDDPKIMQVALNRLVISYQVWYELCPIEVQGPTTVMASSYPVLILEAMQLEQVDSFI